MASKKIDCQPTVELRGQSLSHASVSVQCESYANVKQ